MKSMLIAVGACAFAFLAGACSGGGDASSDQSAARPPVAVVSPTLAATPTAVPASAAAPAPTPWSGLQMSPLADLVQPAGNLRLDTGSTWSTPEPVSVDIEGIGVVGADVADVGVESSGELEIPGSSEIGWYRWSSSPGQEGSAVLAAHIAYNGSDGVFRNLDDVKVGALVTVRYDDGSVRQFEIVEKSQYRKDELPFDRVFAKTGDPVVTLITCGGTFNRALSSYDDNVVAYAVPV